MQSSRFFRLYGIQSRKRRLKYFGFNGTGRTSGDVSQDSLIMRNGRITKEVNPKQTTVEDLYAVYGKVERGKIIEKNIKIY